MGLTEIANKHNCDKGTQAYEKHSYTLEYGKHIPSSGAFNLLEIGVWHGDSLRMWNEYNPEMKIWGIDNDKSVLNHIQPSGNISITIGSQSDKDVLSLVASSAGQFRFIIDDGSHNLDDILASFGYLYPFLEKGGVYFIEDLHAQQACRNKLVEYMESASSLDWELSCNQKLMAVFK